MKKFTIFGERNSGTNYLKKALQHILCLKFTSEYGFKHWYIKNLEPRGISNTTTDNECDRSIHDSDDTLFIFTIRNANDWVGAMYKRPYHIKESDRSSIYNFASKNYISYENKCPRDHQEKSKHPWYKNSNHKHPYFIDEADNLIELRNLKNNHFHALKNHVKYYYVIRQEYLLEDIQDMINKYDLKYNSLTLPDYKAPKKYVLDVKTINFIQNNLDNNIDNNYY